MTSPDPSAGQPAGRDPVATLRRIAFLLERRLADGYRIKAYRGAAATLLGVDPGELRSRSRAGTLRDLPGIGAKTSTIVEECLAGRVPAYLTELEATAGPLAEGGAEVRQALRGDLHSHSDWSDGGSPIEEMAMTAVELGRDYLVLTDHSPRLKVANGLTAARLTQQLEVVAAVDAQLGDFRLLRGIEVDILDDGALDQTQEMLGRLDVVVASVPGFGHGIGIIRGGLPMRGSRSLTPGGLTPLLYAARDGRLESARILLAAGANLQERDPNAITPLLIAIANDHPNVAQFAIERGADVNVVDWYGRTPLWTAIETRNMDVDSGKLENGVDRDAMLVLVKVL
ncbi:MAG: PHP domain-containing protein, partial [Nocardioidaceae bacterium]